MALPLAYSFRNVLVRKGSTLLTALGIAMTVAVFSGVMALNEGFEALYRPRGREDVAIYLRPGATSEGESGMTRERAEILVKERPEVARDEQGAPLAAAETYLAVYMEKVGGGVTNTPLRGIQPASLKIHGDALKLVEGDWLRFGTDEVMVGRPLTRRMKSCAVGDTLMLNVTPFKVVGVYEVEGAQGSEVWGDVDRMMVALERPFFQRVVARVIPGTDFDAVSKALEKDSRTPMAFRSEREYLAKQTSMLGGTLRFLAGFLTVIMGLSAVIGATITMLSAVSARTHEIGILMAIGYRGAAIFAAFLIESLVIGVFGGLLGILIVLPFNGMETGAVNWNTFTDVSFAFRVSPALLLKALWISLRLGLVGGAIPALAACLRRPVDALRQA